MFLEKKVYKLEIQPIIKTIYPCCNKVIFLKLIQ